MHAFTTNIKHSADAYGTDTPTAPNGGTYRPARRHPLFTPLSNQFQNIIRICSDTYKSRNGCNYDKYQARC